MFTQVMNPSVASPRAVPSNLIPESVAVVRNKGVLLIWTTSRIHSSTYINDQFLSDSTRFCLCSLQFLIHFYNTQIHILLSSMQ